MVKYKNTWIPDYVAKIIIRKLLVSTAPEAQEIISNLTTQLQRNNEKRKINKKERKT